MHRCGQRVLWIAFALLIVILSAAQTNAQPAMDTPITLKSPEIMPDHMVTFRFADPQASEVTLNGTWDNARNIKMIKDAAGVWSVTVGPLADQLWAYWYMVDGAKALDPSNAETQRDGRRIDSMLMISGPSSANWDFKDVLHGTIEQVWYPSPTLKQDERRMYVYLPPSYYTDKTAKFPVLYLLHGGGGDEDAWTQMGRANEILDNLIASGRAAPMIVVMPNINAKQTVTQGIGYGPTPARSQTSAPPPPNVARTFSPVCQKPQDAAPYTGTFADSFGKDLVPFVESTYRVIPDQAHRAIAGLSMGGAATIVIALHNPTSFSYIAAFSPAPGILDPSFDFEMDAIKKSGLKFYWTGAGDKDFCHDNTVAFEKILKDKGFPTSYKEIPGSHYWFIWRDFLSDYSSLLFK